MPLPFAPQAAEPMDLVEGDPDVLHNSVENHQVYGATLDLEQYSSVYSGLAKIYRLLYVADHSPPLKTEALLLALNFVKEKTFNCQIYQQIHQKLSLPVGGPVVSNNGGPDVVANQLQIPPYDNTWVEQTSKKGALKLEKLDTDLKHYKSNSIKESIRRGQDDLGEHYLEMGDLTNALKCFSRARDYCTTNKHILAMCFNVIKVSVFLQNWSLVLSYVNRAESTSDLVQAPAANKEKDTNRLHAVTKLKCAAGLAELANKKYKAAAKNFLQANFDYLDYPEVLSAANVAAYGSLCAMASFDRHELQKLVISNAGFKQFLEVEPQLNDIVVKFYESKYAACLRQLDEIRENLMLDMYLAKHVNTLYGMIRNRGLIQYFSPYLSVDMNKMAAAFNTSVPALEDELMQLILDGQIKARIDSHNKVLYGKDVDLRTSTYERALAIGKAQQQRTKTLILRAAMHKAHITVKSPVRSESQPGGDVTVTPENSANSSPTRNG